MKLGLLIGLVIISVLWLRTAGRADETGTGDLLGRIDHLWLQRDAPGAMQDAVSLANVALAVDPQNYEAQWRLCRATFWVARTQPNRFVKKAMAMRARELSERAMAMAPNRAEGHYYHAVALGEYANTIGIVRAVTEGLAGKIEASALKAYELNPDFDDGGPIAVIGRYYFLLPWPKRDLARSRRYLEELKQRHPHVLIGRYYLADTYHALGDDDAARRELDFIMQQGMAATNDPDAPSELAGKALHEWFAGEAGATVRN